MEETYTFSRALHLMRYSGKKMRCLEWPRGSEKHYLFVEDGDILYSDGKYADVLSSLTHTLDSLEIMGSWVEVK